MNFKKIKNQYEELSIKSYSNAVAFFKTNHNKFKTNCKGAEVIEYALILAVVVALYPYIEALATKLIDKLKTVTSGIK